MSINYCIVLNYEKPDFISVHSGEHIKTEEDDLRVRKSHLLIFLFVWLFWRKVTVFTVDPKEVVFDLEIMSFR